MQDVASPHLEGVDAELSRDDVDDRLAKQRLYHPRAAICRTRRGVRPHRGRPDLDGRYPVGTRDHLDEVAATRTSVGTAVLELVDLHREDDAVFGRTYRHLDELASRVRGGDEILVTILDPLHRPPEQSRGDRDRGLLSRDGDLLAERAADVFCENPDGSRR